MLAKWLRSGIACGRSTVAYPLLKDSFSVEYKNWNRVPVSTGKCGNCNICVEVCPLSAISVKKTGDSNTVEINADRCICCGVCIKSCNKGLLRPGKLDLAEKVGIPSDGGIFMDDQSLAEISNVKKLAGIFKRSLHVRHIDTGSCNACISEILSLSNPYYNFHRLGIFFTASPKHADVLLVTGAVTIAMRDILRETFEAMPRPRIVIAAGGCAADGCLFKDSERFAGQVADFLPVAIKIPGCPPNPFALLNGLLMGVNHPSEGEPTR